MMADTEEYFPRGGKKPAILFKQSSNFLGAPERTEKKKRKPKKKSEGDDGYLSDEANKEIDQSYKNCSVGLSYKIVKPGLLVLARVRQIFETRLTMMLPCRLMGNVMACHISEPYNKTLEAYVNDKTEKVLELSKMFRPGQYVAVKVLETKEKKLMLSTMPQHINEGKLHCDIVKGAIFQGAVSSVEDHGYVMDLGIPNTRAFLPKKDINPDVVLSEGMLTWCVVKSTSPGESYIVTVSNNSGALQGALLKKKPISGILPGNTVEFTVDTPLENGIEGVIFGDLTCYIQRQHVDKVKGKKPSLGQKVRARVLYVMPTRNTPFLTMKNIFESMYPDLKEEQKFKDGHIVEDAQVLRIAGHSIHFKLGASELGIMSVRRVQVDEELSDEQIIAKSYPIGSTHKVRVLMYNMSDYLYSVSDEPQLLKEKYFSIEELAPGELVTATVTRADVALELMVGRVKGIVPKSHITETGITEDTRKKINNPQKKFKVGQKVSARVLLCDSESQSLFLTMKPSLLAPDLEVLAEYEHAQVGKAYVGVIRVIRNYLLVSFFNNVTAFVPRQFVTRDTTTNLVEAFHVGQIVKCTILNVRPEGKKMTGSLVTEPFTPDANHTLKRKLKQDNDVPLKKQRSESNDQKSKGNKRKKGENQEVSEQSDNVETANTDEQEPKKKKDKSKKKKDQKEEKTSEESDAIDTDFNEEEHILTPQELGLLDLSDCSTIKQYKKRITDIKKAIEKRAKRLQIIEAKLSSIEERGLNAKNKKFHTAMQTEKLIIQDRIKKLAEGLAPLLLKLKELGGLNNDDYKVLQKKRKLEKKEMKRKEREQIKQLNKSEKILELQSELAELSGVEDELSNDNESDNESLQKNENSDTEVPTDQVTINNQVNAQKNDKKNKKDTSKDVKVEDKQVIKEIKVAKSLKPALEVPSAKEFWSAAETLSKTVQEEESSSSDDELQDQPKKKRKKLSVADKLSKARAEDERVRSLEAEASASEHQPRSVDQFERALLAHPASSQLWIAYMAFHLQSTELDKARAVAKKALNTIPFREEEEKLNVWLALLNLEHRFGTKESQQKTLEDALQMNEPYKVHSKLLDILVETGKQQELATLADVMMRKYKRLPASYLAAGEACYKLGLVDKARQLMQKAIAVLEKKEHVNILVKFALMERSHGARERAEALFEQVLTVYPQRVDVTSVYVDMLLKSGDIELVRQVLERMTALKLPARKMKVLFKKWVEVEEKIGDETNAEKIRQRAMEFIQKAKF